MDAGELRDRVELQSRAQTPTGGSSGSAIAQAYATVATVWAKIEGLQGGRYIAGRQTEEVATHKITIRHRTDFTAWRFVLIGTRRLEVRSLRDPDGGKEFMELWCEELTP
jgi:SPP1 family predicted phage head-tail adaptor